MRKVRATVAAVVLAVAAAPLLAGHWVGPVLPDAGTRIEAIR